MSILAVLVFFPMAVMPEISADSDAMKEAQSYIYSSDLQKPDQNFRKVTSVSKVDRSDGLSMEMDVVQTSCQVSSKLSQEKVYTDACPVSNEYEKIKYQLYNIMEEKKNAFEAQAHIMAQWMDSMPDVEQMIAKSIQQLCTSNYQYHKSSELDEAKNYIYQSDLQSGRGNFRKVLEVRNVDTSEGLSLTIDALPTTCPVSSNKSLDEVYSDECRTTKDEYDKIECHLKLDQSKSGQIECTYYAV
ncbi:hypothetical protein T09_3496 [Trichinella sp. T9]|nr:hypothetical protein T09_3496 [Trichinella sp. T9]